MATYLPRRFAFARPPSPAGPSPRMTGRSRNGAARRGVRAPAIAPFLTRAPSPAPAVLEERVVLERAVIANEERYKDLDARLAAVGAGRSSPPTKLIVQPSGAEEALGHPPFKYRMLGRLSFKSRSRPNWASTPPRWSRSCKSGGQPGAVRRRRGCGRARAARLPIVCRRRVRGGAIYRPSSVSRTLRKKASGVIGFWKKWIPASSTP